MPVKLIRLKSLQLVKLIILSFCFISLYFIYIHNQISSISEFEFYNIVNKRHSFPLNTYNHKNSSFLLLDESTGEQAFNEKAYFCINKLVNCTINSKKLCPYVPIQLGIKFLIS